MDIDRYVAGSSKPGMILSEINGAKEHIEPEDHGRKAASNYLVILVLS